MARKLNSWTLGGLIVGPILGSGIVLLPPLAYQRLGTQAFWAWTAVLLLGAGFAAVFVRMTLRARSDAGISGLVAQERGPLWGDMAANFLTGAVIFGVAPVVLTAARLWPSALALGLSPAVWGFVFLALTIGLLWAGLTAVSGFTLVLSTLTAVLLTAGAVVGLIQEGPSLPLPDPATPGLGPTMLVLFWAIVGWEVVANYSQDVADPERTVPRAGLIGLIAVSVVYLSTTLGLQTFAPPSDPTVASVLVPLVGSAAELVAGVLAGGLCLGTVLMFTGAVTRMTAQRATEGKLPRWLSGPSGSPRRAIAVLAGTSALLLGATQLGWLTVDGLVATANLFFLGNALLGLMAAWTILSPWWRPLIVVLAGVLGFLVVQASPVAWALGAAVAGATWIRSRLVQ